MSAEPRPFRTAGDIAHDHAPPMPSPFRYGNDSAASPEVLVVRPEVDLAAAKALWNAYLSFRDTILSDPACFDMIGGSKEMNRTGATRLAVPFGLSIEERLVEDGPVQDATTGEWDYRFRVHVRVSKGSRFVDGIGSCRLSEIEAKSKSGEDTPLSKREHFALTRASTRATKRAIADILGGTEAD